MMNRCQGFPECSAGCYCNEEPDRAFHLCFHCGEERDEACDYESTGERYCSTGCALECAAMCGRGVETSFEWQIMERCAGGAGAWGRRYQANDTVAETLARSAS